MKLVITLRDNDIFCLETKENQIQSNADCKNPTAMHDHN